VKKHLVTIANLSHPYLWRKTMRNYLVLLLAALILACVGPAQAALVVDTDLSSTDVGYIGYNFDLTLAPGVVALDPIDPPPAAGQPAYNVTPYAGNTVFGLNPGEVTVTGSGDNIGGTHDYFQYAYMPLTGNGTMIARVDDMAGIAPVIDPITGLAEYNIPGDELSGVRVHTDISAGAKPGIMIRSGAEDPTNELDGWQSLLVGGTEPHAQASISAGRGYLFHSRTDANAGTVREPGYLNRPMWGQFIKLTRFDDQVLSYYSDDADQDGVPDEWVLTTNKQMSALLNQPNLYIGLAVSAVQIDTTYADPLTGDLGVAGPAPQANRLVEVDFSHVDFTEIPKMQWLGQAFPQGDWDGLGVDPEDPYLWFGASPTNPYPNSAGISAVIPASPATPYVVTVNNAQQAFALDVGLDSTLAVVGGGSLTLSARLSGAAGIVQLGGPSGSGTLTTGNELQMSSSILRLDVKGIANLNAGGPITIASVDDAGAGGELNITGAPVSMIASNGGFGTTTLNVNDGGTLNVLGADGNNPNPIFGAFGVNLNDGNLSITGLPVAQAADQLNHFGYEFSGDYYVQGEPLQRNLDNNGGLMALMPTNIATPLTTGPTNEGLDFDDDGQFQSVGATTQIDNYANLWLGNIIITAGDILAGGGFQFQHTRSDDRNGMWLDLDNNGIFSHNGLKGDEELIWDVDNAPRAVTFDLEGSYMVAFTHGEGTGGSNAQWQFETPTDAMTNIKPSDQLGRWESVAIGSPKLLGTEINVTGNSTLAAIGQTAAEYGFLGLADGSTLTVSGPDSQVHEILVGGTATLVADSNVTLRYWDDYGAPTTLNKQGAGDLVLDNALDPHWGAADNAGGSTTFNIQGGRFIPMGEDALGIGIALATVELDGGEYFVPSTGELEASFIPNALGHFGYDHRNDAELRLGGNTGLMEGLLTGNPTIVPDGFTLFTEGPGGRGMDFSNDAEFLATGVIHQNDNYTNLFIGNLIVSPENDGANFIFDVVGDDDISAVWLDIDGNGIFDSTGDNQGDNLAWENGDTDTIALAAGKHMFAIIHAEGGGGSNIRVNTQLPGMGGQARVKPADAAQQGFFEVQINTMSAVNRPNSDITVLSDSLLTLETDADSVMGDLTLNNGTLTVQTAGIVSAAQRAILGMEPVKISFGATTITGPEVGLNTLASINPGMVSDGGVATTLTKTGPGNVEITQQASLVAGTAIDITDGNLLASATLGAAEITIGSDIYDNTSVPQLATSVPAGDALAVYNNNLIFDGGDATFGDGTDDWNAMAFVDPTVQDFYVGDITEKLYAGLGTKEPYIRFGDPDSPTNFLNGPNAPTPFYEGVLGNSLDLGQMMGYHGLPDNDTGAIWQGVFHVEAGTSLPPGDLSFGISEDDAGVWYVDANQDGLDYGDLVLDDNGWSGGNTFTTEVRLIEEGDYAFAIGFWEGGGGDFLRAKLQPPTTAARANNVLWSVGQALDGNAGPATVQVTGTVDVASAGVLIDITDGYDLIVDGLITGAPGTTITLEGGLLTTGTNIDADALIIGNGASLALGGDTLSVDSLLNLIGSSLDLTTKTLATTANTSVIIGSGNTLTVNQDLAVKDLDAQGVFARTLDTQNVSVSGLLNLVGSSLDMTNATLGVGLGTRIFIGDEQSLIVNEPAGIVVGELDIEGTFSRFSEASPGGDITADRLLRLANGADLDMSTAILTSTGNTLIDIGPGSVLTVAKALPTQDLLIRNGGLLSRIGDPALGDADVEVAGQLLLAGGDLNMTDATLRTLPATEIIIGNGSTLTVDDALVTSGLDITGLLVRNGVGAEVVGATFPGEGGGDITVNSYLNLAGGDLNMTGSTLHTTPQTVVTIGAGSTLTLPHPANIGSLIVNGGLVFTGDKEVNISGAELRLEGASLDLTGGMLTTTTDTLVTVGTGRRLTIEQPLDVGALDLRGMLRFGPDTDPEDGRNIHVRSSLNIGPGSVLDMTGAFLQTESGTAISIGAGGKLLAGGQGLEASSLTIDSGLLDAVNINISGGNEILLDNATIMGDLITTSNAGMLINYKQSNQGSNTVISGAGSDWGGRTRIIDGSLELTNEMVGDGSNAGLSARTNLWLNGEWGGPGDAWWGDPIVLQGHGSFARMIGNDAGQVRFERVGGGFAAKGGPLTVSLDTIDSDLDGVADFPTQQLWWNSWDNGFSNERLMLGSFTADDVVTLTNDINTAGGRDLYVFDNPNSMNDMAVLSGAITDNRVNLYGGGILRATNEFNSLNDGIVIRQGAVDVGTDGEFWNGFMLQFEYDAGRAGQGQYLPVILGNGTLERQIGGGQNQVRWWGHGGFAARGGDLTVTLQPAGGAMGDPIYSRGEHAGDGRNIGFGGQDLVVGSVHADSMVTYTNQIIHDKNNWGDTFKIDSVDNPLTDQDVAKFTGGITVPDGQWRRMELRSWGWDRADTAGTVWLDGEVNLGSNEGESRIHLYDGILRAEYGPGKGFNDTYRIEFNQDHQEAYAIYESWGTQEHRIGNKGGGIRWENHGGGFAAWSPVEGDPDNQFELTLLPNDSRGGTNTLYWDQWDNGFNSRTLTLGSPTANNTFILTNPIDLRQERRTWPTGIGAHIQLFDNPYSEFDKNILAGVIMDPGGPSKLTIFGAGHIGLHGENTFAGELIVDGNEGPITLSLNNPLSLGNLNNTVTLRNVNLDVAASFGTSVREVSLSGGFSANIEENADLTLINSDSAAGVGGSLIKNGGGALSVEGIVMTGPIDFNAGELTLGDGVASYPGGPLTIADGLTLRASGHINRRITGGAKGGAGTTTVAIGDMIIGNLGSGGYDYEGNLVVGPYSVTLLNAAPAQVFGVTIAGGTLSSANGLLMQAGSMNPADPRSANRILGTGAINSRLDTGAGGANQGFVFGTGGPLNKLKLNGIVTGGGQLINTDLELGYRDTNPLHRILSKGKGGQLADIRAATDYSGAVTYYMEGNQGADIFDNDSREYTQGFATSWVWEDVNNISGTLLIEAVGGFVPADNDSFLFFQSRDEGFGLGSGRYAGWFDQVILPASMSAGPGDGQWDWDFTYLDGSHNGDVNAGWFSASLMMNGDIPDPTRLMPLDILGLDNPSNHDVLIGAAAAGAVPNPMHFVISEVTSDDIEIALYVEDSAAYLADLNTDLGLEGLLYEARDGLFDAFTFKPADPATSYDLYLWNEAMGIWEKEDSTFEAGTSVPVGGVSEFLIWGVDLDNENILSAGDPNFAFTTVLDMSSLSKGSAEVFVTPVPEPSTLVLLGIGLAALLMWRRRRS